MPDVGSSQAVPLQATVAGLIVPQLAQAAVPHSIQHLMLPAWQNSG
jgi:hypothetical protein